MSKSVYDARMQMKQSTQAHVILKNKKVHKCLLLKYPRPQKFWSGGTGYD